MALIVNHTKVLRKNSINVFKKDSKIKNKNTKLLSQYWREGNISTHSVRQILPYTQTLTPSG